MQILQKDWLEVLGNEFDKDYYKHLETFVNKEYNTKTVYPPREDIYNALNYTSLKHVKVLLVGQDPYFNENQAHGLSFSVLPHQKIPKSLVNIYKELQDDMGMDIPNNGYLKKWADQGVLLINTVLTVRAKEPNSHSSKGWEIFTDEIIKTVNEQNRPIVIFLWGKPAQKKREFLTNPEHLILEAPHPSPLSAYRGFFGCKCFSKCNEFLATHGIEPIDWQIENI
ncbi:uracil-DNA glycosylase [Petrocella sp. FN5]|uniref:uracil-DNA glycosylase n=1 Tax=Petrocella sp. FN5 TaxID=3032002 RepID=UPI0023DBE2E2|nr:uracil-DNA glycosylase [Petrocella sp. FN5]MDF1618495.1 uracil-DNA glycosylase [Petrocella sp. FN5]